MTDTGPLRRQGVAVEVVDDVAAAFSRLVVAEAPRSLAVSGGSTARRCYERLAQEAGVDWRAVEIFLGDERWVPVDHDDSNEGMARRALLDHVEVAAVHSMRGAGRTPEEAAAGYDAVLRRRQPLDLVHLGLGADGHTASLFPGSSSLAEGDRLVVAAGDDRHAHRRVTLTLPALARARLLVFTVAGAEKREAFARVRGGDDVPAARVRAARIRWLVDRATAGEDP
ncbi:MAG: 6-phosphogluconolactonase [Acidimicrobiia bacterium]|nr:6-phosphogluconolactonase [Acidimicrobiia bacterium]